MRVLYVEDDSITADLVQSGLKPLGIAVDWVVSADEARAATRSFAYDCVVLDLNLPDGDGLAVLKELRASRYAARILILSARSRLEARIAGLDAGADDYLTKPFDVAELIARLRALSRRPAEVAPSTLSCGNLELDPTGLQAAVEGKVLPLSRREFAILEYLLRNTGRIVSKQAIEDRIYGFSDSVASNSIEVHIHHLRRHLTTAGARVVIETRRGTGYLLSGASPS